MIARILLVFALLGMALAQDACDATPSEAPDYTPPEYKPNDIVTKVQKSASAGADECDFFDQDAPCWDKYVRQLAIKTAIPVAVFLVIHFLFFLGWCVYSSCGNNKCCECPAKVPSLILQIILSLLFGSVLFVSFFTFNGRGEFTQSIVSLEEAVTSLDTSFNTYIGGVQLLNTSSLSIAEAGSGLQTGSCNYSVAVTDAASVQARDATNDLVQSIGEGLAAVHSELASAIDDLDSLKDEYPSEELNEIKDYLEQAKKFVDIFVGAIVGIVAVIAVFGIVAIWTWGCLRTIFFNFTFFLAFILIPMICTVILAELLISVIGAEICVPNPRDNFADFMNARMSSDSSSQSSNATVAGDDYITYMLLCEGVSPFEEAGDTVLNTTVLNKEFVCNLTTTFSNETFLVDDGSGGAITLTKENNTACTMDLDSASVGVVGLGDGAVDILDVALSCKTLNVPLVKMFDDALCTSLIPGLKSMYSTQLIAMICLFVAIYMAPSVWRKLEREENGHGDPNDGIRLN